MTLRELVWMVRGRVEQQGELAGIQLAYLTGLLTGEQPDPRKLNPYAPVRPIKKSEAQIERESKMGFRLLGKALFGRDVWGG